MVLIIETKSDKQTTNKNDIQRQKKNKRNHKPILQLCKCNDINWEIISVSTSIFFSVSFQFNARWQNGLSIAENNKPLAIAIFCNNFVKRGSEKKINWKKNIKLLLLKNCPVVNCSFMSFLIVVCLFCVCAFFRLFWTIKLKTSKTEIELFRKPNRTKFTKYKILFYEFRCNQKTRHEAKNSYTEPAQPKRYGGSFYTVPKRDGSYFSSFFWCICACVRAYCLLIPFNSVEYLFDNKEQQR